MNNGKVALGAPSVVAGAAWDAEVIALGTVFLDSGTELDASSRAPARVRGGRCLDSGVEETDPREPHSQKSIYGR